MSDKRSGANLLDAMEWLSPTTSRDMGSSSSVGTELLPAAHLSNSALIRIRKLGTLTGHNHCPQ
eukprot:CAMPEP_0179113248 /NCGR_PEP_ID=MMETSP0796-20121207/52975_1 /TAXON_ID=73915 /ORGANISM="Pyrodinium bahamense, Strain pbaha01" /LENGTH=63 /DNA_ID=CAMNT_0020811439 /DNA_START=174 /DNA_END=362 /DNA_ORIENTATION=-